MAKRMGEIKKELIILLTIITILMKMIRIRVIIRLGESVFPSLCD